MTEILAHPLLPAIVALCVVGAMFVLFALEVYPTEVVALSGGAFLLATGLLTPETARAVFTNPAPWTIAAMFILSGALVRTGALNALTELAKTAIATRPKTALLMVGVAIVLASAFVNNTPVVVLLIPVAIQLSSQMNLAPSKLLIPLSYITILGGMCTLIGTSTNLLVDGVAQASGLEPFTLFEITPAAVILAAWGFIYLRFAAPRLLPDRTSMAELLSGKRKLKFFTQVAIPHDSVLIGQKITDAAVLNRPDIRVVDVIRADESLRRNLAAVILAAGDRLVLRTNVGELLSLKGEDDVELVDRIESRETTTVETLITPGCRMVGRSLGELRLRRRFGVYVLAVHRMDQNIGTGLDEIRIRVGDTLLIEGNDADIARLADDMRLVDISQPSAQPYRRNKAPLAIFALLATVTVAALGLAAIFTAAIAATAFVLVTRCIDAEEAFAAVDGRLLVLIFSMLAVGAALTETGAISLLVSAIAPRLADLHPFFILWIVFLLTSILTELVSNNAVAVAVTPLAIALGETLGADPRPLVIAVMIGASASFSTPIGYQTNTLVYGPGGYKFTDFFRIGAPLNLTIGLLASAIIPFFWPLF